MSCQGHNDPNTQQKTILLSVLSQTISNTKISCLMKGKNDNPIREEINFYE